MTTPHQIARQIQYRLLSRAWSGGSEAAFPAVEVTADIVAAVANNRRPFVGITIGPATCDAEHPDLVLATFDVTLVVDVAGDVLGAAAIAGGSSSRGRGLLEAEVELLAVLADLDVSTDGVGIIGRSTSEAAAQYVPNMGYVAARTYTIEVMATAHDVWHAPYRISASVGGGGVVTLTWSNPSTAYDYTGIIVRRTSGTIPTISPTGGSSVTVAGGVPTSTTDSPGAGVWSYSVFGSTLARFSAADARVTVEVP